MSAGIDHTPAMGDEQQERSRSLSTRKLRPPTRVPGYDDEEFLGKGAFGEVWKAVNRNTGRQVAIKFYNQRGGLDWSLLSREVEKLRFLFNSRQAIQLLEVGWNAEPPYYVMEYMSQGSLEDKLRDGPLPVEQALALFREILIGLSQAHGKGVLHCDLKPANILLDQDGKPRLADFGQSRLTHEHSPALGTLFYMAPEQASLNANPDVRWDVYALGALLYRMLTGHAPYRSDEGATEIQSADNLDERLERYRQLMRLAPAPAGHRQVAGVDKSLAEIIDRCLAVEPRSRYPNVQAVLSALEARSMRRARRPLLIFGAVGPALGILIVSLFAYLGFDRSVHESRDALIHSTQESNRFAAQFVASTIARQINQRFNVLEEAAAAPQLRQLVAAAEGKNRGSFERQHLQLWLDALRDRNRSALNTENEIWFINNELGVQIARSPPPGAGDRDTVGENFSFRDYFHNQGKDLARGSDFTDVKPSQSRAPYMSSIFQNFARKKWVVPFSIPIWNGDDANSKVVAVLTTTVLLGDFGELRSDDRQEFASLIDIRSDTTGKRGLIMQHPSLADLDRKPSSRIPEYRISKQEVTALEELCNQMYSLHVKKADPEAAMDTSAYRDWSNDYRDPVGKELPEFAGRWLAEAWPVFVKTPDNKEIATGWIVLVQQKLDDALEPVDSLKSNLIWLGFIALAVALVLVTGLWAFVGVLLNDSPRSKLARAFRQYVGLPTTYTSRTTGTQTGTLRGGTEAASDATIVRPRGDEDNNDIDGQTQLDNS